MSEVDLTVANTILQQLGGRRFILMTGAKDFIGDANSLMFRIGRNSGGVTKVKIILEPGDTYRVIFYRIRQTRKTAAQVTIVHEADDIYFDQLGDLFKRVTGLETQMPRILGLEQRSNPIQVATPKDLYDKVKEKGLRHYVRQGAREAKELWRGKGNPPEGESTGVSLYRHHRAALAGYKAGLKFRMKGGKQPDVLNESHRVAEMRGWDRTTEEYDEFVRGFEDGYEMSVMRVEKGNPPEGNLTPLKTDYGTFNICPGCRDVWLGDSDPRKPTRHLCPAHAYGEGGCQCERKIHFPAKKGNPPEGTGANDMTPARAKAIVLGWLRMVGLPFTRVTARTVSFQDLARVNRVVVTIHGWQPNARAEELKQLARQHLFIVQFSTM